MFKRFAILAALALTPGVAMAVPTNGFVQEYAGATAPGVITADLYKSAEIDTRSPTDIRFGAFGGELLIDANTGGGVGLADSRGIGYKWPFTKNMAAYGMLFLDNSTATTTTNYTLGFSYTGSAGGFFYNANAEIFGCSACVGGASESFVNVKGGGFYKYVNRKIGGTFYFGAEIDLAISPTSQTDIFAGARWQPKPNATIDMGLLTSIGGTSSVATPAFLRLTLGL